MLSHNAVVSRYVTSMYWAMSTMATVGYGDVTPVHFSEKIVAMVGMLVGVTIFAYIMSTVSSLLSTFNAQTLRAKETQRQLDSFCRAHKLPTNLARKLGTYYDYVLPRTVHSEDLALVSGLSAALRQQVSSECPTLGFVVLYRSSHVHLRCRPCSFRCDSAQCYAVLPVSWCACFSSVHTGSSDSPCAAIRQDPLLSGPACSVLAALAA